jgi:hypothetical protein
VIELRTLTWRLSRIIELYTGVLKIEEEVRTVREGGADRSRGWSVVIAGFQRKEHEENDL